MSERDLTILVGTTKGAFLLRRHGAQRLEGQRAVLRRLADQPCHRRSRDGHDLGRRRRRLVRRGRLALDRRRRDLAAGAADPGTMDEWAAKDPDFARMIGWTPEPLPFAGEFSQVWSLGYAHGTLYAGTKPASLLPAAATADRHGRSSRA